MVCLSPQPERQVKWDTQQVVLLHERRQRQGLMQEWLSDIRDAFAGSGQTLSRGELRSLANARTPGGLNAALRNCVPPERIQSAIWPRKK